MQIPLKILETIKEAKHIAIFSHKLPDGDSVGASLALGLGLQKLGKEVKLYTIDPVPRKYRFLKGSDRFLTDFVLTDRDILAIILDCSDLERIEPFKEQLKNIKTINIDHHSTNGYFGALNFVDPQASATGEIVFFLLQELGVELDEDIANALYVALTTDTGSFKYENTTARTFSVAASLSKYGIAPAFIAMKVFEERPLSAICLLAKALGTLQFAHNKKIAYLSVTENMMRECQATAEDLDGIINYAKNIEGVEIGLLFYCKDNQELKVGFRSKNVDVSTVAQKFNGGGHQRAAGCCLQGDCEQLKKTILHTCQRILNN